MTPKVKPKRRHWTKVDLAKLDQMYAKWPKAEIMRAIPSRSWTAIVQMASERGLKRTAVRISAGAVTRMSKHEPRRPYIRELRYARIAAGETARGLARRLGWSESRLGEWEMENGNPRLQALEDWCTALGYRLTVERVRGIRGGT